MTGMPRSDAGVILTRCTIASRKGCQLDAAGQFNGLGEPLIPGT